MALGAGRPPKVAKILGVRELTREEVLGASSSRGRAPAIKSIRDSHHMVARLFALGLRPGEVAERSGYSLGRISVLYADPALRDLIEKYRGNVTESYQQATDEYYTMVAANRVMAARLLNDKLSVVEPEDISIRELVTIHADAADRTGYPKRTVAVNFNVDFAARLDNALKRSNEARSFPSLSAPATTEMSSHDRGEGGPRGETSPPSPRGTVVDFVRRH
jgi:hypothetical protein